MEFAEEFADSRQDNCERFLSPYPIFWPDIEATWTASRIDRQLQADGNSIGDHDVWIAALALRHDYPVATCNEKHFNRVDGLSVRTY